MDPKHNSPEADHQVNSQTWESMQGTIKLLRDQVDALQIDIAEKKSWLKIPSNIISISAVVATLIIGGFSINEQQKFQSLQTTKEKKDYLNSTIEKLIDTRVSYIELSAKIPSNQIIQQDILFNASRRVILEQVQVIVDDLGVDAPTNGLLVIGYELQLDSNFKRAEKYFLRALKNIEYQKNQSEDIQIEDIQIIATVYRSLGSVYMMPNTGIQDIVKSRRYWQQSVDLMKKSHDDYSIYTVGFSYQNWSLVEYAAGNKKQAAELLGLSKENYQKMNPLNPMRHINLNNIDQLYDTYDKASNPLALYNVVGQWTVEYFRERGLVGRAVAVPDQSGGGLLFYIDVFSREDGRMVKKYFGPAIIMDAETIRIDWQGLQFDAVTRQPTGITGNTLLRKSDDMKSFVGNDYALGYPPVEVTYSKLMRR